MMPDCVICGKEKHGGYFLRKFRNLRLTTCRFACSRTLDQRLKPLRGVKVTDFEALDAVIAGTADAIPAGLKERAMLKFFGPLMVD